MSKFKIERVLGGELNSFKDILDKYEATYHINENLDWKHYAMIKLDSVDALKCLAKELNQSIIVLDYSDRFIIYDDYIE